MSIIFIRFNPVRVVALNYRVKSGSYNADESSATRSITSQFHEEIVKLL